MLDHQGIKKHEKKQNQICLHARLIVWPESSLAYHCYPMVYPLVSCRTSLLCSTLKIGDWIRSQTFPEMPQLHGKGLQENRFNRAAVDSWFVPPLENRNEFVGVCAAASSVVESCSHIPVFRCNSNHRCPKLPLVGWLIKWIVYPLNKF